MLVTVAGPRGAAGTLNTDELIFPRSFKEIVEWLARHAPTFTCYNMDYDARAILKFLPSSIWMNLYRYGTVLWRGLSISYQVGKYFTVTWKGHGFSLFDCCQHYQKSLRQAAREVLKDEQKEEIPAGWYKDMSKPLRHPAQRERVLQYARRDAEICRQLWATLDTQYRKLGIDARYLARPLSPGQIAAGFFKDKIRFRLGREHNDTAKRAYRGGRIEVFQRGIIPRCFVYDLKSAYPWALSTLPDPRFADVMETKHDEEESTALYSVYCVRVSIPQGCLIPPLPKFVNTRGGASTLVYPAGDFKVWVTGPELALLKKEGWLEKILFGLHLVGERRPWLTSIPRLFRLRRSRPEISQAIKLVLNSIYGKLAQQRDSMRDPNLIDSGTRRFNGEWVNTVQTPGGTTNFFVAAYVTALVRCRLWETMKEVGFENCVLAATDGLVTTVPLPRHRVGDGRSLGDWTDSVGGRASALVVGTGVYSLRYGSTWHDKVRGFRPLSSLREMLRASRTRIRVKNRVAYTLGDFALHGSELNDMIEINRTLDVNFDVKRSWPRPWVSARALLRGSQESKPLILLE